MFLATFAASFYVYHLSRGQMYRHFKAQPKRFMINSLMMAAAFGFVSMMPDLANILLSPMMIVPPNIKQSIMFALIQCLSILIIGPPVVWFTYRLAIPLAHKMLSHRY
jgi:hypothetical protein